MGGANLELFKFSVYIFFPIATMYYFGAPEFYDSHVKQIKFWPEKTNRPPTTRDEILIEIEKLKAKKKIRETRVENSNIV
ncbi:unnamed protein product [Rhizophagus irregularis]|uniref:Protein PET100, mitochondrial n=4 Tax=Rhizophagus irregularis TaxID=588596 RepID=A0A2I1FYH6_9GLOM|nr:hypothetical protein GLOIN_2v1876091 [Rhizophagus irregularis DAOM 181602=DAOM 197198]EXX67251.1 hypothetical protein RirG_116100 [Rhizophagus irregularis DAOM 197198w]PKC63820.1 hypothetical protein RhiirA1_463263 [Rhizophagus irregularis]PKK78749.1 hypothetical protein RhiirC2_728971 [Rhizophagus irregularis]PKY39437.1 hypothetical protein RhiirA4_452621 [Rhizophagus irregularis]POG71214.1 hypothetical protein GLOIN_2v1876091 [Rhizophagus irregularis DAOM 181602=DAOM 197198]|eukprot:XP_025178080.1 hypothetical protein GLOIN_2v1876091 [Rhizophagus irregularis DAOM 181602=DAOM 197198]